jgi:predicted O-methyltransferase YrrM
VLTRIDDFFALLGVGAADRELGRREAALASAKAQRMMDVHDYEALAAIALRYRPARIFEIGTYLGVTSDFLLALLPECRVVSIAYVNPRLRLLGRRYNNSDLRREEVGSRVHVERRPRFTQLHGDSHRLDAEALVREHGRFDLVFIDGDHSREGVRQDTELARRIAKPSGIIAWHDANPKPAYLDVRRFLENDLALPAIATADTYVGGIAAWSPAIEDLRHGDDGRATSAGASTPAHSQGARG